MSGTYETKLASVCADSLRISIYFHVYNDHRISIPNILLEQPVPLLDSPGCLIKHIPVTLSLRASWTTTDCKRKQHAKWLEAGHLLDKSLAWATSWRVRITHIHNSGRRPVLLVPRSKSGSTDLNDGIAPRIPIARPHTDVR